MTYSRTIEKLGNAKRMLMEAQKAAEEERLPLALIRQIDTATGRLEHLQNNIMSRGAKR